MNRHRTIYLILLLVWSAIAVEVPAQTGKNTKLGKASPDDKASEVIQLGQFKDLSILECSGIAPSFKFDRHFWIHNDSGDDPVAFLIHESGRIKKKYQLEGVSNVDFEDCVCFEFEGDSYLAIGDIGNNRRNRSELWIYVFKEPEEISKDAEAKLIRAATVSFTYADGVNRNSESLAYLPDTSEFVLSSKLAARDLLNAKRAELFTIKFEMKSGRQKSVAKRIGSVPGGMNTAMDISRDGRFLVLRNYLYGYLYELKNSNLRLQDQDAKKVTLPVQRQGEAICFSKDGKRLIVTSEGKHQMIFSVRRPK